MRDCPDAPLAPLTTLGLGGPARRLVTVEDEPSLLEVVRTADAAGEPLLVLGGGSNVVLPDAGFPGTVVRIAVTGRTESWEGEQVLLTAAAGEDWDALVARCGAEGLVGIEALSGIPGLVGASPIQNIGAYGQEVAQTVSAVRAYDRISHEVVTLSPAACEFAYRQSIFKRHPGRWVVLGVTFALRPGELSAPVRYAELARALDLQVGDRTGLVDVREAVLALRRSKGMVLDPADPDTRSVGSFFTNPLLSPAEAGRLPTTAPRWPVGDGRVKVSAAWLIEAGGFAKGAFDGPVGISRKHTLALVHRGGGTTDELLAVARTIRDGVRARFGIELLAEPVLIGADL